MRKIERVMGNGVSGVEKKIKRMGNEVESDGKNT